MSMRRSTWPEWRWRPRTAPREGRCRPMRLDWRADRCEDILTLGLDTDVQLAIGHVPLVGTLEEGLAQVEAQWRDGITVGVAGGGIPDGFAAAAQSVYGRLLSLLLYLCAEDADYERPPWPVTKRTKKGLRLTVRPVRDH